MLDTKRAILEIKAIIEAMNFFEVVGIGKVKPIVEETVLPSIYICYDYDLNELNGKMRKDGGEYDRILYLTLEVHLDLTNQHDLYYVDVRDRIEEAILRDSPLWNVVIDRDVIGSKWDKGINLPKKQGEITLEIFTRACIN